MMSSFWLLLVTIIHCLIFMTFPTAINAELAFVRPNTSVACAASQQPCLTFNEYAQQVDQYFVDNTTFLFLPGTHQLDAQLDLEGLSNIVFAPLGDLAQNVQILLNPDPSVNITWTNCENVEVSGLVFILSGQFSVLSESDNDIVDLYSAELIFQDTTAILTKLTLIGNGTRSFAFCNSSDIRTGDLVAIGTKATILLYASNSAIDFYGNSIFTDNLMNISDGGYIMLLYNCHYNFSGNISFVNNTAAIAIYIIGFSDSIGSISGNLSFVNNTLATAFYIVAYPDSIENNISGNLSFVNNTFKDGGGAIIFIGGTNNISENILFVNNTCIEGGSQVQLFEATWYISGNVSFIQNDILYADSGMPVGYFNGGAAISSQNSMLIVSGVALFVRNQAIAPTGLSIDAYGGAIYADTQSRLIFEESSNISFIENSAASYGGAISIVDSNLTIYGRVLFENNSAGVDGGATYSLNSVINMTGTVDFNQNSAQRGGAMAFIGFSSKLRLIKPLTAKFTENSANLSGGAIFFQDDSDQLCFGSNTLSQECFIELSSRANISLNFDNNTATTGRIFYGGNLDACTFLVDGMHSHGERLLDTIASISNVHVNITNPKEEISNVSSDPIQVCICKGDGLICNSTEIETIRGRKFTLQAVVVGQGGIIIFPSAARISLDSGALTSAAQRVQPTGNRCTNISYGLLAETDTTITLFPDNGACRDVGIARTTVSITFRPCPSGFVQNGSECVCDKRLQRFNALCNVNDNSIQWISTSNRFWIGALYENDSNESTYEGLIIHPGCPFDFCVDTPIPITLDNIDIQCNHNHSGTLCGSCREGYSITLGTLHCLPCSNDYLTLIFPFALTGTALVAVLLLLRLTVTAGTINGLIFYANIVQANGSFFFPARETNILTVFIAWLNLDLGIETCFYDGMTTYAYTWLQFVFPFYVWFLIGLIIVMSHYSSKLTKIFGRNPVAALATLFLLSYSKLLRTIIASLSVAMLEYPGDKYKIVWFYDGKVSYGSGGHSVLVIFAILVLVFLFIPYTLLLFFAHWLQALSHWRILSWLNKIKPFMDTYHAPFKKQTRYWTGLLLFVRLVLAGTITNESILVVIISLMVALTSLAWMQKGIYENYFNNILEAFFIANLSIFAATMYTYRTNVGDNQNVIAYSFVGLAFATFVLIVLFHAYLVLSETAVWKKIPKPNIKKYFLSKKEENKDLPPGDDRGRSFILQAPTQTSVDLREPLLEQ